MDLFLIILSGVCLIGLAIYWIRLWREARDHKRAQALHRVANEKAAVRGLASNARSPIMVAPERETKGEQEVKHLRKLLEFCGEAWGDWCEEPTEHMYQFLVEYIDENRQAREDAEHDVGVLSDMNRDLAKRLIAMEVKARVLAEEEAKAMNAMDFGADDARWEPGTTAVDALIKENKALRMGYKNDPTTSGMISHQLASQTPWMFADERGNQHFLACEPTKIPGRPLFRYNEILRSWDVA